MVKVTAAPWWTPWRAISLARVGMSWSRSTSWSPRAFRAPAALFATSWRAYNSSVRAVITKEKDIRRSTTEQNNSGTRFLLKILPTSIRFHQSHSGGSTLPLHGGESSLGGSQGGLQMLSFLGHLPMMTQHLVPFIKITPGVISIIWDRGIDGRSRWCHRLGLEPSQQVLDADPSNIPTK